MSDCDGCDVDCNTAAGLLAMTDCNGSLVLSCGNCAGYVLGEMLTATGAAVTVQRRAAPAYEPRTEGQA